MALYLWPPFCHDMWSTWLTWYVVCPIVVIAISFDVQQRSRQSIIQVVNWTVTPVNFAGCVPACSHAGRVLRLHGGHTQGLRPYLRSRGTEIHRKNNTENSLIVKCKKYIALCCCCCCSHESIVVDGLWKGLVKPFSPMLLGKFYVHIYIARRSTENH